MCARIAELAAGWLACGASAAGCLKIVIFLVVSWKGTCGGLCRSKWAACRSRVSSPELPWHHAFPANPKCTSLPTFSRSSPSQLALLIKDKSTLGEDKLDALKEVVGEEDKAREIIEASAALLGTVSSS
jgi:hypothetical protein